TAAINHLGGYLQIGLGELYLIGPLGVDGQSGGGKMWPLAGDQLSVQIIQRRAGGHFQLEPETVGEALAQLVFQPGVAMPAQIESRRRIAAEYAQGAVLTQLLKAAGLLAGNQQYRAQQGQGGGECVTTSM